ncbi:hypothetical protein D9611_003888 [Ephemerocybe angulata]|uniref:RING-type domain-containing protein n=1 Tax=Ephemerocybe angulata TaxID=980116 RepID=A0A8H5EYN8_9AGAR|nr:hypothetical protein D9611_003888 [Tulosesus angulatus]
MSVQDTASPSAPTPLHRSNGDLSTSPLGLAATLGASERHGEPRVPELGPTRSPNLTNSVSMAVLDHWDTQLRVPTSGAPSQGGGSSNPQTPSGAYNGNAPQVAAPLRQAQESWLRNTMSSMGIGRGATPARKSEMSLLWNLCWGFSQVAVVSVMAALSSKMWKSRHDPSLSEWQACDRPLGIWACLWVTRVFLASGLAYWDFVRIRMARELRPNVPTTGDATQPTPTVPLQFPQPTAHNPIPVPIPDPENPSSPNEQPPPPPVLPYTHLYSRLTLLSSLLTLSWFLTAHILEYTSLNTCRHTSPHLWWLIFGILCIMYVMVLEVLLLGFIILVLAPILFVFWNIFLFCIGRHPAQNPHMIKPDIGKLPRSLVDRIPLVMYIPPPPTKDLVQDGDTAVASEEPEKGSSSPGDRNHEYPPKSPTAPPELPATASPAPKKPTTSRRFRFFRRKATLKEGDASADGNAQANPPSDDPEKEEETWEGHFERSDYPFVVLEGNRAICAICLMDFEEPKRKHRHATNPAAALNLTLPTSTGGPSTNSSPTLTNAAQADNELKLADAGEGAQPLRLLACGHVFHQTCLDPWLTDVSGRCPVCQRAVEVRELKKRKRNRR